MSEMSHVISSGVRQGLSLCVLFFFCANLSRRFRGIDKGAQEIAGSNSEKPNRASLSAARAVGPAALPLC
jgi:hypothetical protein